jgi:hypothetical protein
MLCDESAQLLGFVAPDGIDNFAGLNKTWPTLDAITSSQCELSVCQLRLRRLERSWVIAPQLFERLCFAPFDGAQQVFRLMLELFEIGANRQLTVGHLAHPRKGLPGNKILFVRKLSMRLARV